MPTSAPTRCLSCKRLVRGRCPTCKPSWSRKPKTWDKGSTWAWRLFRAGYLSEHPLCVGLEHWCGDVATVVDHLDGCDYDVDRMNPDWCRSLCQPHHDIRTGRQGAAAQMPTTQHAHVTLVCGPPCAGKNTYVTQHARPGDLVVDLDAIISALSGSASHEHDEAIKALAFDARDAILARLWSGQHNVNRAWIILTGATEKQRHTYRQHGARIVMVIADQPTLQARAAAERPQGWSTYIDQWLQEHDKVNVDSVVDTSL